MRFVCYCLLFVEYSLNHHLSMGTAVGAFLYCIYFFIKLAMVAIMVAMLATEVPMVSHWPRVLPVGLGLLGTIISLPGRTFAL